MRVLKRDNRIVPYESDKVILAVMKALIECEYSEEQAREIAEDIEEEVVALYDEDTVEPIDIEAIQDCIEQELARQGHFKASKSYILYRDNRSKERDKIPESKFFSKEFLSKYKHAKEPFNPLGSFVYYRTYSKWLPELGRRENWFESVKRMVEFNCSLAPTTKEEAEKLFDNVFYLRQNLSGRMAFIGGTETSKEHPLSLFNCAFITCDDLKVFNELFYILMLGAGVGFRVTKEDVAKLPKVRQGIMLVDKQRQPKKPKQRNEYTTTNHLSNNIIEIVIGDSREGFKDAVDIYFKILTDISYRGVDTILVNYDNIREANERLKRFGGRSGGFEPLVKMFNKIHDITQRYEDGKYKLKPIDCMDIANIIGENVVAGNIRRTAEIILFSPDDDEILNAKSDLYINNNGEWVVNKDIIHRAMSNNTIAFEQKPTREMLHNIFEKMKVSAEPGFYNLKEALRRNPNAKGLNPCGK